MASTADAEAETPKKRSKLPLLLGLVLALLGGGGGFFAAFSGLLPGAGTTQTADPAPLPPSEPLSVGFIALDPLVISLPASNGRDHLRFAAQLEVPLSVIAEVEAIKPRIVDILNGYLRAVELAELEDPTSLHRMRAQMLRRVQVVAGEGRITDLLIMEFVLS